MSGFSKTTRPFPKMSEDARIFPKMFGIISHENDSAPYEPSKVRDFGESIVIYSFYIWTFLFFHWFEFQYFCVSFKPVIAHTFQPGVRTWSVIFQPAGVRFGRHNDGVNELAEISILPA